MARPRQQFTQPLRPKQVRSFSEAIGKAPRTRGAALGALPCSAALSAALRGIEVADPLGHLQQMLAHFIAGNLPEMTHQFDLFAAEAVALLARGLPAKLLEEERNRP